MTPDSYRLLRAFALAREACRNMPSTAPTCLTNAVRSLSSADRTILQTAVTAAGTGSGTRVAPHAQLDYAVEFRVLQWFDRLATGEGGIRLQAIETAALTTADVLTPTIAAMKTDEVAAIQTAITATA